MLERKLDTQIIKRGTNTKLQVQLSASKEKDLTLTKHSRAEADLGRSGKATVSLCTLLLLGLR